MTNVSHARQILEAKFALSLCFFLNVVTLLFKKMHKPMPNLKSDLFVHPYMHPISEANFALS